MYPFPEEIKDPAENDGEMFMNASSEQDCTGLIPAAPQSEAEYESYEETYDFLPSAVKRQPRDRC